MFSRRKLIGVMGGLMIAASTGLPASAPDVHIVTSIPGCARSQAAQNRPFEFSDVGAAAGNHGPSGVGGLDRDVGRCAQLG